MKVESLLPKDTKTYIDKNQACKTNSITEETMLKTINKRTTGNNKLYDN